MRIREGIAALACALLACSSDDASDIEGGADAASDATLADGAVRDGAAGPGDASTKDATSTDGVAPGDGGAPDATDAADAEHDAALPIDRGVSVLQHHKSATRDGVYVDPLLTKAAAALMHADTTFDAPVKDWPYGQPLYVENGPNGKGTFYVATQANDVYAFDETTGTQVWKKHVADAPSTDAISPCGTISPLGVVGSPAIDLASRSIYFDAMTTTDGGTTLKHAIFALSIDDGATRPGWPVDVDATAHSGVLAFKSKLQNQRGAVLVQGGTVYVPYGGHFGDCGDYHGWIVGVSIADPTKVTAWATPATQGGIWGPGGLASDGASIFATTGNTSGTTSWAGGEAMVRLTPELTFSNATTDFFTPGNWHDLDLADLDLGSAGPILLDLPATPPLAVALGKTGTMYLLDRRNLGGIGDGGAEGLASKVVVTGAIVTSAAAYTTLTGTYVVLRGAGAGCPAGQSGDLTAVKITPGPSPSIAVAWCANQKGNGSPMVTTTDGHTDAMVWGVGSENSGQLRAFDGDTGAVIFDGGTNADGMSSLGRYITPIAVKGRLFVAGGTRLHAFTSK